MKAHANEAGPESVQGVGSGYAKGNCWGARMFQNCAKIRKHT